MYLFTTTITSTWNSKQSVLNGWNHPSETTIYKCLFQVQPVKKNTQLNLDDISPKPGWLELVVEHLCHQCHMHHRHEPTLWRWKKQGKRRSRTPRIVASLEQFFSKIAPWLRRKETERSGQLLGWTAWVWFAAEVEVTTLFAWRELSTCVEKINKAWMLHQKESPDGFIRNLYTHFKHVLNQLYNCFL